MGADQTIDWAEAAASALDWWHEAGVDCLVDDAPRDWLALPAIAPAAAAVVVPAGALPDTLDGLAAWRLGPDAPEAGWPGRRLGAEGAAGAALALVTDWPERGDFGAGQLFADRQGRLLDAILRAIGLSRAEVAIVPVATARPPSQRAADAIIGRLGEVARHHVALLRPGRVLVFGDAASRALLGMDCRAARGSSHRLNHEGAEICAIASLHPRLLLERPTAKADAWRDLLLLMKDASWRDRA